MINYKSELVHLLEDAKSNKESYADKFINNLKKFKYIGIFGAGQMGRSIACLFRELKLDIKIDFFCDNDKEKWGQVIFEGLRCVSPAELKIYKDDLGIIIATRYHEEIAKQLSKEGVTNVYPIVNFPYFKNNILFGNNPNKVDYIQEKVMQLMDACVDEESRLVIFTVVKNWFAESPLHINYEDICTDKQYFVDGIIGLTDNEAFVDAGAYDGSTILDFLEESGGNFDEVHSFELDRNNYVILEKTIGNLAQDVKNKINIYNLGLWDKKQEIMYNTLFQSSNIDEQGDVLGTVDCLDNVLKGKKVTFLKMDIESAELKALHGAAEIIKNQKPKLTICVYHSPEHLWEIPLYIKSIVPEYKLFIRHHSTIEVETVCYAVL